MVLVYEVPLAVQPEDIDEQGHVNNVVYLRWVQEAATAHWLAWATPQEQDQWMWVVKRHEIEYVSPALPGDVLVARTWLGKARGARFDRFVEILRGTDGQLLAKAKTTWALLDAKIQRVARVPKDLIARFTGEGEAQPEVSG
ncbi:acyl-CoA thioesterase [Pedomonas mirosovicensis]|uniref:acyl-CoA thioesterase n=1 Tax=Pedomonas mirosovicensis TaxID=2908641 RepID=UPI002169A1F1|nr:acyl-CoA thioesterase [Pedomonas mirosovicensis]MCH8683756.1 acyl-CoA thioesterase [Pedomonas mirosovicensis]